VTRFVHRALLHDRDDDYLRTAVPFLREGLAADDTVLVVGSEHGIDGLRRMLGPSADSVDFQEAARWYAQPTRAIAAYSSYIIDNPGVRFRVIAEPKWSCATPAEAREWMRYESLVNQAFAQLEAAVLCVYDRRTAHPVVVDGALRTHPEIVADSGPSVNPGYTDPSTIYAEVDATPLPPPPPGTVSFLVEDADLSRIRWSLGGYARGYGLSPTRLNDLLVATTELATNALRHGRPPVICRLWTEESAVVLEVADAGRWKPSGVLGFMPPDMGARDFGLWAVRMLCPLVQIRTGSEGTAVRLRVSRD
jgi:hypothetical protein